MGNLPPRAVESMDIGKTIAWLLGEDNPSVRYFTLVDLLDRPKDAPEVLATRRQIMEMRPVSRILATQKEGGYWGIPEKFYAKWKGTFWTFILLADMGASGDDARVKKACEFILNHSQVRDTGGFAHVGSLSEPGGRPRHEHPCMTGKMVRSLIRFGYLDDPRLQHGIEWIAKYQRFDDGWPEHPPEGWPYGWGSCWGKHTCLRGIVWNLKALAEIPEHKRSGPVKRTIRKAAEFILKHHVYKRSHNLSEVIKEEWLQLGFPLLGGIDVLDILGVLTQLGYRDKRMRDAVDLVVSKQDEQGRWKLERSYNGRCRATIEQEGQPSKWITLRALTVLKRFQGKKGQATNAGAASRSTH